MQVLGRFDALRGGAYVRTERGFRIRGARVVTDARADGTLELRRHGTRARLRLRGRAVPPARLIVRSVGRISHVTGAVAGRRVALRVVSGEK